MRSRDCWDRRWLLRIRLVNGRLGKLGLWLLMAPGRVLILVGRLTFFICLSLMFISLMLFWLIIGIINIRRSSYSLIFHSFILSYLIISQIANSIWHKIMSKSKVKCLAKLFYSKMMIKEPELMILQTNCYKYSHPILKK